MLYVLAVISCIYLLIGIFCASVVMKLDASDSTEISTVVYDITAEETGTEASKFEEFIYKWKVTSFVYLTVTWPRYFQFNFR